MAKYNSIVLICAGNCKPICHGGTSHGCKDGINGKLDKEIYMKQPEGYVDAKQPHKVCKLNKSIYGLKQSARVGTLQ